MNQPISLKIFVLLLRLSAVGRIIGLILCMASISLSGQETPSPVFPEDRHQELMEALDFTPPDFEEEEEEELATDNDTFDWSWERWELDLSSSTTWVIFAVLLLLLGFLIYKILGDVSIRKRTKDAAEDQDEINVEDIEEEKLVAVGVSLSLLERAERAQQFDVAVRLLYIQLLKALQDNGLIKYRRDFSNRDYQNQLVGKDVLADFRLVTRAYERYWFGKYPIDRLSYRNTYQQFQALNNRVQALKPKTSDHV